MRTGVYCGSFAPVHNGHILIVKQVLKENLADRVIIVASKDYWDKKVALPLKKRIECLKLFEEENILIDEDRNDNNAPSTYQLFENLKVKYPDDEFSLILGGDNLLKFEKWINADYLLEHYPFIIMNRDGIDSIKELERLNKKSYTILDVPEFNVSSTYIRENLNHPNLLEGLVDPRIIDILKKRGRKHGNQNNRKED